MEELGFDSERLNRYFKGGYSEEDKEYVKRVFSDTKNEKELASILKRQWYEMPQEFKGPDKDLDHILYRIHYDMNINASEFKKPSFFINIVKWSSRIAAILVIPMLVYSGIYFYKVSDKEKNLWVEIKTPAWTRAQFNLPDGTTGWLNSSSNLKYNGNFSQNRNVTLSGEAFFNVFKDEKKPFIVNVDQAVVTVLGTSFNIASYENENKIEVVLEEGNLIFSNKDMKKTYTMNPNELVVYDKLINDFSVEKIKVQKYASWKDGKLVFRNDPLDVIVKRLARWYNVDIELQGKGSEDLRLRATFIDENLEEVLYFLKRSLPVEFRIEEGMMRDNGIYEKKKVIISYCD